MVKRLLLLLGETASSLAARQYAFALARKMDAEVAGLAGVDLSFIEAPMAGGLGTMAFKVRLEEQLKKQAQEACSRLHGVYEQECKEHGVSFEWLCFEGDPVETLYQAAESSDLIVTGHDTVFYRNRREPLPEMLAKLMLMAPRPVVVCGDEPTVGHDILIAYDGSVPAMRALQLFTLLGLASDQSIYLTSIDSDKETATRRSAGAARYLRSHGYAVEAIPIATQVHPAEVLRIEITARKIGTMVMGAYGHRGFREHLFGSTTAHIAEDPPCALFVYH